MNQTTRYVMDIYQVSVIVRDSLEYLIPKKDGYNADVYKQFTEKCENVLDRREKSW
jgi:hypothetical protein